MQNALRMIHIERQQATLQKRPWGAEVPWKKRAMPNDAFHQQRHDLEKNGLLVRTSLFISAQNDNPNYALIGLKIVPQEPIMTILPPWKGTPWHLSVGFSNHDGSLSDEAVAFINKYHKTLDLRLKMKEVADHAVANLAKDDPIVSDPIVRAFHESSWYHGREYHICF